MLGRAMKRHAWIIGSSVFAWAALGFAFGYLDENLDDLRRVVGLFVLVGGIATVVHAALRLAEDWPRLKPVHDIDLAFVQIAAGIGVLMLACVLGGRPGAYFRPFLEPTPQVQKVSDTPPAAGGGG
jgi:hypothetical protein